MQKQEMLKATLQNSNKITYLEEYKEEKNEGDAESGYSNKEHLPSVLPLRVVEETRRNSLYYNTIVQSHLILSGFFGSEEFSNLL